MRIQNQSVGGGDYYFIWILARQMRGCAHFLLLYLSYLCTLVVHKEHTVHSQYKLL